MNSSYFVYVACIKYGKKTFLYIGQTGDNKHQTARGPFYRIAGHLSKLKNSNQNQIIKGLRKYLEIDNNEYLEEVLTKVDINYTFWKINSFDYNDNKEQHKRKRKETQLIEHWLIYNLKDKKIFNKEAKTEITNDNKKYFGDDWYKLVEIAEDILKEIQLLH